MVSVDAAATYCHGAIMANCGQNCCAGSRNFVHADVYDEFVSKAKACAENKITGDPWKEDSDNGAMVSVYLYIISSAEWLYCNYMYKLSI